MTQNTEQNVQTQDAQVETLAFEIALWGKSNLHERRVVAEKNLKEAEARGAEEQRRKDAEGQEAVAWVPIHPKHGNLWTMTTNDPNRERLPHAYPLASLYTRPANVAALEARIVELVEAEQLARADAKASKARVMVLAAVLDGIKTYSEDTLAGPVGGGGDISWFKDGVEEAFRRARATLTRDGGVW